MLLSRDHCSHKERKQHLLLKRQMVSCSSLINCTLVSSSCQQPVPWARACFLTIRPCKWCQLITCTSQSAEATSSLTQRFHRSSTTTRWCQVTVKRPLDGTIQTGSNRKVRLVEKECLLPITMIWSVVMASYRELTLSWASCHKKEAIIRILCLIVRSKCRILSTKSTFRLMFRMQHVKIRVSKDLVREE